MSSALTSFVKPTGAPQPLDAIPALWRGEITEVMADGMVWVRIPRLTEDGVNGPMPTSVVGLAVGERVVVAAMENSRNDLLVVSRLTDGLVTLPGRFSFVEIDLPPTAANHATRKDYVDGLISTHTHTWAQITGKPATFPPSAHTHAAADTTTGNFAWARMPAAVLLPTTAHDLNSYVTFGVWHQNNNAAAVLSTNYPVPLAGLLEVFTNPTSTFIYQRYTVYTPNVSTPPKVHVRGRYNSVWSPWELQADRTLATAALDGLMPKADKAKLDAAAIIATPLTLAIRNSGGQIQVASPGSAPDAANRGYVDAGDAARAPLVHRHTYADIDGVVPTSALPPLAVTDTFTASSQAAMLALVAERGDMCIRTDTSLTFVLAADDPTLLVNWKQILAAGQVTSVNGKTGVVTLVKGDIGLGNVDNTADTAKPVSAAQQAALNGKADLSHTHTAGDVASGVLAAARLPAVTTSAQGAMLAADKVKLNNASAAATPSTLVMLDAAGRAAVAAPAAAGDIANKSYVDGLQAFRAPWVAAADWTAGGGVMVHPLSSGVMGATFDLTLIRTGSAVGLTTSWNVVGTIVPSAAIDSAIGIKYFSAFFSGVGAIYGYVHFGTGTVGVRAASGTVSVGTNATITFSGAGLR